MKKSELLTQSTQLLNRLHAQFMKKVPFRFRTAENAAYFEKLLRVQNRAFERDCRRHAAWIAEIRAFKESRPDIFSSEQVETTNSGESVSKTGQLAKSNTPDFSDWDPDTLYPYSESLPNDSTNSGDSARHPAGAPVSTTPGAVEAEPVRVGQGGTQCRKDEPFINDFCECDACRPRHDYLAGIHFVRSFQRRCGTCSICGESFDELDLYGHCPDCAAMRSMLDTHVLGLVL
ncbi:hypothetical protein NP590_11290 [Methylomonas sp. SURF-2]|uniref:Uncharacterized protein n=1 Tax=Methylomonas subterranea TaxID=2952225 RepID=A0ABT1TGW7_9GAMM|nr:hypothetical protein [Methylomonas sp. SURF-2]MCQ8104691.1 hypothetical protein [Methylomonas sp. SURF-2]